MAGASRALLSPEAASKARTALFELRHRLELTQKELAKKLGVSLRTFSRWERTGDPISFSILNKLVLIATEVGQEDLAAAFRSTLSQAFGATGGEKDMKLCELICSFQTLWVVFSPSMNETEKRIRERLDELLLEIEQRTFTPGTPYP